MSKTLLLSQLACVGGFLLVAVGTMPVAPHTTAHAASGVASHATARTDATAALAEGKRLLRRNQGDQAFTRLQTALMLFNQTGNRLGVAAVEDALGDVYTSDGQYRVALLHFQVAHDTFRLAGDVSNADAVLAKIGEMYFLLGDATKARDAFARMSVASPRQRDENAAGVVVLLTHLTRLA